MPVRCYNIGDKYGFGTGNIINETSIGLNKLNQRRAREVFEEWAISGQRWKRDGGVVEGEPRVNGRHDNINIHYNS